MQRKILLIVMALNCSMIHGLTLEEQVAQGKEEIARKKTEIEELQKSLTEVKMELYRQGLTEAYQGGYIDELSGEVGIIQAIFDQKTKENEHELTCLKSNKCNGSHYFGDPDTKSSAGRSYEAYLKNNARKNLLNAAYRDLAIKRRDGFKTEVEKLIEDEYELMELYIKNFTSCGNDIECIRCKGMSLDVISSDAYSHGVVATANEYIHNALTAQGISVTQEQLELIIERQKIKNAIENLNAKSKEVSQKAHTILHPKSNEADEKPSIFEEKQEVDITQDQNQQNIFSQ